jgi:hypothetical protein
MSSKKPPLRELSQAPQTPRYAPSTPHAIRALQQRSGAAQRSTRISKLRVDVQRPDSARGILRRLAKITAPVSSRRVSTPIGKENVPTSARGKKRIAPEEEEDDDEGEDEVSKGPDFTLPIVEENGSEDGIESELGEAPTPSALLGAEYDPTITFQTIPMTTEARKSMSERPNRRVSYISNMSRDGEDVDDDRDVEIGRRAVSEGPADRYPRTSFGSIRMSGFGLDEERVSDIAEGNHTGFAAHDDYEFVVGFGDDAMPEYEYVLTWKATRWKAKI